MFTEKFITGKLLTNNTENNYELTLQSLRICITFLVQTLIVDYFLVIIQILPFDLARLLRFLSSWLHYLLFFVDTIFGSVKTMI